MDPELVGGPCHCACSLHTRHCMCPAIHL
jgi:hypothetical protein